MLAWALILNIKFNHLMLALIQRRSISMSMWRTLNVGIYNVAVPQLKKKFVVFLISILLHIQDVTMRSVALLSLPLLARAGPVLGNSIASHSRVTLLTFVVERQTNILGGLSGMMLG